MKTKREKVDILNHESTRNNDTESLDNSHIHTYRVNGTTCFYI